jgi:hypothetical protein
MRVRIGGPALAGAALAAALAMGSGALSSAAATATAWTVRPGGAITATAGKTTLKDTATGSVETCNSARMSGPLKGGAGLQGTGIGSIATATFHCPSPIVPPVKLAARGLPWHLNMVSYNTSTSVGRGTISHLELMFTGPDCSAVVNGTSGTTADGVVAVSYANTTGKLTIHTAGGNLHWYHVSGCAGLVGDGDPATLSAAYAVSPKQEITSP